MRFVLSAVVLLVACSGPEPEHFLWSEDPQSLENPFPDSRLGSELRADFYRPFLMPKAVTPGAKRLFDRYITDGRKHLTGTGNFAPTLLRPSVAIDPASVPGHFARLSKRAGGGYEVLERDVAAEHSTASLSGTGREPGEGFPEFVFVRPSVPLPDGAEGLLVVTRGVKTREGVELGRGRAWDRSRPSDLGAAATALGFAESDIVLALPLKAAPIAADYRKLKAWVDGPSGLAAVTVPMKGMAGGAPVGVWKRTDSDWSTMLPWLERAKWHAPIRDVASVVIGTLAVRDPREDGVWRADWVEDPSKAPVVQLPFVLSVPAGAKPPGGWQTVIGAHGINGRNVPSSSGTDSYCLEHAQWLAAAGIACLGIDAPSHGTRGNIVGFFDIENVAVMRENFREETFDLMQVARAASSIDVDGDGSGDLSGELGFLGNSLGAMMGASYFAMDERIRYAVLNVPGGGLSNILVSQVNKDLIGLLMVSKTGVVFDSAEYHSSFPLIRAVSQSFLESADPVNVFARVDRSRAVLMQMGVGDLTIPNGTTLDLRGAGGLPEATASASGTTPIRAFTRFDPRKYGLPERYDGHNVIADVPAVRDQALDFLRSKGTTLTVPP